MLKRHLGDADGDHVEVDHLALVEDELADRLIRRGRTVGSGWLVASAGSLGMAAASTSTSTIAAWLGVAMALMACALQSRIRFWDRSFRQVGDAAIQRARWRSAGTVDGTPERWIAVFVVIAFFGAMTLA